MIQVRPTTTLAKLKTVLVVDDVASVGYYHTSILKKAGFRCEGARDGREALQKLQASSIDLVLLDLGMPNLSGWEFIQQIRAHATLVQLPVLVISSEPIGEQVRQGRTV